MHGYWIYSEKRCWLIRKLNEAEAAAWCEEGWEPNRWQLFAARMLGRIERWRAAWLCLFPPKIEPGYSSHGYTECEWHTGIWLRFKAAVCLVLGLSNGGPRWYQSTEVVYFDCEYRSWSEVNVGDGVFENWFAYVNHDSEDVEYG